MAVNYIALVLLFLSVWTNDTVEQPLEESVDGEWIINSEESSIEFEIQALHLFVVKGSFSDIKGDFVIRNNFLEIDIGFSVDPSSVDTGNEKRNAHLQEEEFFYVEKYPAILFAADRITKQTEDNKYSVEGSLTIKDVTKRIVVPVNYKGINSQGQILFTGAKNINRREYHIDYTGRGVGDTAEVSFRILADRK